MKILNAWFLLALPLLCGCGTLFGFVATPEGKKAAADAGLSAIDVIANPLNPVAWVKLLVTGAGLAAGGLGLYHSPTAAKAVHRKVFKRKAVVA